jgi:putative transposase
MGLYLRPAPDFLQTPIFCKLSRLVPKAQRSSPTTLAQWLIQCPNRDEALRRAHTESGLTMTALAAEIGLTVARVSQLIARAEGLRLAG